MKVREKAMFLSLLAAVGGKDLSPVAMENRCDEPKVVLVSEGRARIPIVTADGKRERWAAMYLAATIRDITGVRPTVYVETRTQHVTNSPALRIAKSDESDRFRVVTKGRTVRFLGCSDFAVFDWCERVLGVRYYCEDCKTFPRSRELAVGAVDYADWPVFSYRNNWPLNNQHWARVNKVGGTHQGGVNVHAPHKWFEDPDVRTNHPNIFARQPDGSRGEMPLLCYGNPETLEYYKRRIAEHIAGVRDSGGIVDTNRHIITVSHWDVRLECSCEHCRRLFGPSLGVTGSGSPIIWGYFLKDLAKWAAAAHPGYTVSFLPYLNVCDVPAGLDLTQEGNCEAMVCSMPGLAWFKEPSVREHEEALICDWARVTGRKVLNWHYGCWPRELTSAPYLFGKTIAEHYRRMAPFEAGSFICGGGRTAAERLSNYVWMKCLWNPAVDVDAVYDVFAERMFGPAAGPMRKLLAMQEDGWARHWPAVRCNVANVFGVSYPPADIDEMKRLLCEAAALARADALATARIRWYAADFAKFFADEERHRKGVSFEPLAISHAESAPAVDGRFDEPCWAQAPVRAFVPAFGASRPTPRGTTVRAVWTEGGVYFAFRCQEPDMQGINLKAAYGELKEQDTLEMFFDPSGGGTGTCYRLMFDVRNRRVSTASNREWSAEGVASAVVREADAWYVEVFVPFATFGRDVSREHWRGNFVRWHPDDRPGERERSRLSTLGDEENQNRDAFSHFWFLLRTNRVR